MGTLMRSDQISALFVIGLFAATLTLISGKDDRFMLGRRNLTYAELQKLQELWKKHGFKYSAYQKTEIDYPCSPLAKSPSVPTSVHRLRPADIKVIGAMGDSISAGTGVAATNIFQNLIQYRGLTWSGGGQTDYEDQITVPNILKKFNPEIYGYATGSGNEDSRRSFFNVAVSGSTSSDLANQARELVDRMKTDPKVDVENDWKVVTILSGNNDLCDYCEEGDLYNVKNFRDNTLAALDILHAELPRTLVNLVEPINVDMVKDLNKGLLCSILHRFLCNCMAFPDSPEEAKKAVLEADLYQVAAQDIARSGRYDTRDDFTVVHQPFTNNTYLVRKEDGEPDLSYFAPDCFHLSRKGQAAAASALWNNMIEPVGKKTNKWAPGEPIECPSESRPYFFTNKNSDMEYQTAQQVEGDARIQRRASDVIPSQDDDRASRKAASVAAVIGVCVVVALAAVVVFVVFIRPTLRRNSYRSL